MGPRSLELCAGAGGQALGLEQAGFAHEALVEIDRWACATLRLNRPAWRVIEGDIEGFDAAPFRGVDLVAGGLPCPPFSVAGKQLGAGDERNLFPSALAIIEQVKPRAVMIENVRGILDPVFDAFRSEVDARLRDLGYKSGWKLHNASDYGVPQLRPRVTLVALRSSLWRRFSWPGPSPDPPSTVGEVLYPTMASRGWKGARQWSERANTIAPTIVGGSKKHGGPDLGPTRARKAWASLGVEGISLADEAPGPDFADPMPRLTVPMVALLQGFPPDWRFAGGKTAAYRQVGNAFPPPMARAVAERIRVCLERA